MTVNGVECRKEFSILRLTDQFLFLTVKPDTGPKVEDEPRPAISEDLGREPDEVLLEIKKRLHLYEPCPQVSISWETGEETILFDVRFDAIGTIASVSELRSVHQG